MRKARGSSEGRKAWKLAVDSKVVGLATSFALVAFGAAVQSKPKSKAPAPTAGSFAKDVAPLINKNCISCHQGKSAPAGLNLTKFKTEAAVKADLATWERVSRAIGSGSMPPSGMPKPTQDQRKKAVEWIERAIAADCQLADPGKVTIRRLNREEYNNTIRDLIGLDLKPAEDFPSDDVGYGFDNIGDVLSISPLLMEKYLEAAERVAAKAIRLPGSKVSIYQAEEFFNGNGEFANLNSRATIRIEHVFQPGAYRIKIRAYEDHAGSDNARMLVAIGAQRLDELQVSARRANPVVYELPFRATSGKQAIEVTFTNDFYQPQNPAGNRDRNLHVDYVEVLGPIGGSEMLPESHRRIIPGVPPEGKEREYARKLLAKFASRAYRRPVTNEEADRLVAIYDLARKYKEPFERGIQLGVQAALVSPNFLFRAEIDPKSNPTASRALNGYELASRLSYFLWSSMPDDRLLMFAADGSLANPAILSEEVRRMLKNAKAKALADNFAEQWLTLRKLSIIQPDPARFPDFTPALKSAMETETKLFFSAVVEHDRSVLDFIEGKFSYLNGPLARHYGIPNVSGNEFRKVALSDPARAGILTHGSVLTVTSNPTRTSPTKRGKWILEQILGTPPPPPPPGVDVLAGDSKDISATTLREKMELHRTKPECASCHSKMDPLGFGLEQFDAVGSFRGAEDGKLIDASGVLPDGRKFTGPAQLRSLLMQDKELFVKALSEKLLTYALGRGLSFSDKCFVDEVALATQKKGYKFSAMVEAIVNSEPFRMRRVK